MIQKTKLSFWLFHLLSLWPEKRLNIKQYWSAHPESAASTKGTSRLSKHQAWSWRGWTLTLRQACHWAVPPPLCLLCLVRKKTLEEINFHAFIQTYFFFCSMAQILENESGWGRESPWCVTARCVSLEAQAVAQLGNVQKTLSEKEWPGQS